MSADKYPSIFSRQMETIVCIFSRQVEAIVYLYVYTMLYKCGKRTRDFWGRFSYFFSSSVFYL